MREFAALFAALDATTSTRVKVDALERYFRATADADAAWAVWFLAGGKPRQIVPVKVLRALAEEAADIPPWLFEESYQAVGDLAETIALLLPAPGGGSDASLAEWIEGRLLPLRGLDEATLRERLLAAWSELDADGRFLWNKLITGGFRVGVSKLLVTRALGAAAGLDAKIIAERLAGAWTPSATAFRALVSADGDADAARARPYPFFLAHPLQAAPATLGDAADWIAEWKWDGIRAQVVRRGGEIAVWSRGDELVTERFPEVTGAAQSLPDGTVLDGEILAWRDDAPLPFAILQQRVGRKTLGPKVLAAAPVAFVAYDLLEADGLDLRLVPLAERRARLERLVAALAQPRLRVSPRVVAADWDGLAALRAGSRARGVEGLMLKHAASRYGVGRTRGDGADADAGAWWKWKIDPYSVDAVLVYAQRGHGRRASLYTDYTFAVWRDGELVPFAKAYSGLTDAEFREVDAFIKRNTLEKFGPVRSVTPELVFEIGFEGIQRSPRHKSGIAVRFPRMLRIRHDKRPADADSIATLQALLG